MKPSVWIQSTYTVDADTNGEDSYRTRRELKPAKSLREALAAGADPNDHNALHEAVDRGAIGQVQALLKAGAHFDKLASHERRDEGSQRPAPMARRLPAFQQTGRVERPPNSVRRDL